MLESLVTGAATCAGIVVVSPKRRTTEFREVPAAATGRKRDGDEDSTEETIIVD